MMDLKMKVNRKAKVVTVTAGTLTIGESADWPVPEMWAWSQLKKRWVLDADGWILDARRHVGNKLAVNDETRPPALRIKMDSLELKGLMVRGSPNGVVVSAARVLVSKCSFMEVGEDALNLIGAKGCEVRDCFFGEATDKLIQANFSNGTVIEGCTFQKCTNAVRIMGGSLLALEGCSFISCDTVLHVTRKGRANRAVRCKYAGVKTKEKTETGGKIL